MREQINKLQDKITLLSKDLEQTKELKIVGDISKRMFPALITKIKYSDLPIALVCGKNAYNAFFTYIKESGELIKDKNFIVEYYVGRLERYHTPCGKTVYLIVDDTLEKYNRKGDMIIFSLGKTDELNLQESAILPNGLGVIGVLVGLDF